VKRPVGLIVGAVAATLVLAAVSTVALAAMTGAFRSERVSPDGRCEVPELAGTVVDVTLTDSRGMGRMMGDGYGRVGGSMRVLTRQRSVPAGTVSFRVANRGDLAHELVVVPLTEGRQAGERPAGNDGRVNEGDRVGEVSRSCDTGRGDGINSGSAGWATLDLPAGEYELLCNLPGHYASGMFTTLRVQ
jgi:uncharacterized cupredoxin-like copper-binding protein